MMVQGYDTPQLCRADTLLRIRYLEAEIADRLKEIERLSKIANEQDERVKALERLMMVSRAKTVTPTTSGRRYP